MNKEQHNHKYPNFLIKYWDVKPWSKKQNKFIKYNPSLHMGEKSYYPDELEMRLSIVESRMGEIIKKLNGGDNNISNEEWWKIILFVKIQSIRLEGISNFINRPDSAFVGNNNFLFGAYSSEEKSEVIKITKSMVDIFIDGNEDDITFNVSALGIVIWESKEDLFAATESAIFKEVDLDGKFLYSMLPISPRKAIVISKNSYFASNHLVERTKSKYGDTTISLSTSDKYLINNFKHEGFVHLPFKLGRPDDVPVYTIDPAEAFPIIQAMMDDSDDLIFIKSRNEQYIIDCLEMENEFRKIYNSFED